MITAEWARERSIKVMKEQFNSEAIEHLDDRIGEACEEYRFGINVSMKDELPEISSHKHKRLLIEYLRLLGYKAFYVDDILEIRWQI